MRFGDFVNTEEQKSGFDSWNESLGAPKSNVYEGLNSTQIEPKTKEVYGYAADSGMPLWAAEDVKGQIEFLNRAQEIDKTLPENERRKSESQLKQYLLEKSIRNPEGRDLETISRSLGIGTVSLIASGLEDIKRRGMVSADTEGRVAENAKEELLALARFQENNPKAIKAIKQKLKEFPKLTVEEQKAKNKEILQKSSALTQYASFGAEILREYQGNLSAKQPILEWKEHPVRKAIAMATESAVPSMGTAILISIATRSPAAGIAVLGETSGGQAFQEALEKGSSVQESAVIANLNEAAEIGGEMLVFPKLFRGIKKGVKLREAIVNIMENGTQEGITGFFQEYTNSYFDAKRKGYSTQDSLRIGFYKGLHAVPENALIGGIAGAGVGAASIGRSEITPSPAEIEVNKQYNMATQSVKDLTYKPFFEQKTVATLTPDVEQKIKELSTVDADKEGFYLVRTESIEQSQAVADQIQTALPNLEVQVSEGDVKIRPIAPIEAKTKGVEPDRQMIIQRGKHTPVQVIFPDSVSKEAFRSLSIERKRGSLREGALKNAGLLEIVMKRLGLENNPDTRTKISEWRAMVQAEAKKQDAQGEDLKINVISISDYINGKTDSILATPITAPTVSPEQPAKTAGDSKTTIDIPQDIATKIEQSLNIAPTNANTGQITQIIEDYKDRILSDEFKTGMDLRNDIYKQYGNEYSVNLEYALEGGNEAGRISKEEGRAINKQERRSVLEKSYKNLIDTVKKEFTSPLTIPTPESQQPEQPQPPKEQFVIQGAETGQTMQRGLSKTVSENAIRDGIEETFGQLPEYKQVQKEEQAILAKRFMDSNWEQAKLSAMGENVLLPDGLLPSSVYVAVWKQAKANGDAALMKDLRTTSKLITLYTQMGQQVSMLAELGNQSDIVAMGQIVANREASYERKNKGKKVATEKKTIANEIKAEIIKESPTKNQIIGFIKDLKC